MAEGMQQMDWALERFVADGVITARDALEKALDKDTFQKIPSVARGLGPEAQII